MSKPSLWTHYSTALNLPALEGHHECDVAIIGGGITGISVAQKIAPFGLKTVVLEAREVGGGSTADSTGNLYATTDKNLKKLLHKHDVETISTLIKLRKEAIDDIENNVRHYNIDCDFKRVPWHLYGLAPNSDITIREEFDAATKLGLEIEYVDLDYPYKTKNAIRLQDQAQLNSKLYTQGLAKNIVSQTCHIYEHSAVTEIEENDDGFTLKTERASLKAKYIVHATHTPKGIKVVQTLLGPYREYGIACKIKAPPFTGIYWGYHGSEDFISSRIYHRQGVSYLVVVGYPHKVGQQENNQECFRSLESFAKEHFDISEISFRWGGQHYRPADHLPYIGKESKDSNVYLATGFSTDGLVYGALSARIISELIQDKESAAAHLFRPYRLDVLKAAPDFIKENTNVAGQYLKEIFPKDRPDLNHIKSDHGEVIEHEGQKLAVYRDGQGALSICSAVCPHLKCVVNWNLAEKSWDCPCHGSRFDTDGAVIDGPALESLSKWIEQ